MQQDQTILAMVSGGLGISIMEELMLYHCAYPLAASTLPKVFHRDIGICVKDKNALSHSTQVFIDHVRRWVLQNFRRGGTRPSLTSDNGIRNEAPLPAVSIGRAAFCRLKGAITMKKLFTLCLALVLALGLAACGRRRYLRRPVRRPAGGVRGGHQAGAGRAG